MLTFKSFLGRTKRSQLKITRLLLFSSIKYYDHEFFRKSVVCENPISLHSIFAFLSLIVHLALHSGVRSNLLHATVKIFGKKLGGSLRKFCLYLYLGSPIDPTVLNLAPLTFIYFKHKRWTLFDDLLYFFILKLMNVFWIILRTRVCSKKQI